MRAWFWCHSGASSREVTATQPGRPGRPWHPVHKLFLLVPAPSVTRSPTSFSRVLGKSGTDCGIVISPRSVVWRVEHRAFLLHLQPPPAGLTVLGNLDPVCWVTGEETAGDPTPVWTHGPLPPIKTIEAAGQWPCRLWLREVREVQLQSCGDSFTQMPLSGSPCFH